MLAEIGLCVSTVSVAQSTVVEDRHSASAQAEKPSMDGTGSPCWPCYRYAQDRKD